MVINELIKNRESDFKLLCRNHTVKYLYAFGSSVTNKFDFEKSDIDLIVEIEEPDPIAKGEKLISFWDKLEEFFKKLCVFPVKIKLNEWETINDVEGFIFAHLEMIKLNIDNESNIVDIHIYKLKQLKELIELPVYITYEKIDWDRNQLFI